MLVEQKIRAGLFCLSVLIFFLGLPFILSFSLGYKFDRHTFKFTRTGLIVLKTQPQGADIYLDQMPLKEKTPHTINEILPGTYHLKIELEKHYPWLGEVKVEAGKVTRLEKIILFPLRPNVKQLNKERLSLFWVDEEKGAFYYINPENNSIYKSDLEGEHFEPIAELLEIKPAPIKWRLSADREKLLYFNHHQIAVVSLASPNEPSLREPAFIIDYPKQKIVDAYWHSDSYYIILIGEGTIDVLEARPNALAVTLVNLNLNNTSTFYDMRSDTLYFLDTQKAADGKLYDNLYKLDLNIKTFPLQELLKSKSNE